eukprot:3745465-Amphidinium_carterae.1
MRLHGVAPPPHLQQQERTKARWMGAIPAAPNQQLLAPLLCPATKLLRATAVQNHLAHNLCTCLAATTTFVAPAGALYDTQTLTIRTSTLGTPKPNRPHGAQLPRDFLP